MGKQIQVLLSKNEQKRVAKLWGTARRAMIEKQFSDIDQRHRRLQTIADWLGLKRILDASIGNGFPTLSGVERFPYAKDLYCSDGDSEMLALLRANYFKDASPQVIRLIASRTLQVRWEDLPNVFGKGFFSAVMITGNSLPYVASWNGEQPSREQMEDALVRSLTGVHQVLNENGVLLFDTPSYGEKRVELCQLEIDGETVSVFMQAHYVDGIRHWTLGSDKEAYTLHGHPFSPKEAVRLVCNAGFAFCNEFSDDLSFDPHFYRLFIAFKSSRDLFGRSVG